MYRVQSYRRRLRIWETDYGRNAGWTVERRGEVIAILSEPRSEDMFWDSYRLEIVSEDPELRSRMFTREFWANAASDNVVWRNREFGEIAAFAFPALSPFLEPGRLLMRGLYISLASPKPWDHLALWIRRWFFCPRSS